MSKYEIVSLIETMNNYDDLASKAKARLTPSATRSRAKCFASARKS